MRIQLALASTLVAALLALPQEALTQEYRSSIGWTAGAFKSTSLNDGATGDVLDMAPSVSWVVGAEYDHWFGSGQVGLGLRGSIGQQDLQWVQGERSIYMYTLDANLLFRLVSPSPEASVIPYIAIGGGGVRRALGDGPPTTFAPGGVTYAGEEQFQLAATGALGFDFFTALEWGDSPTVIRLEARDVVQFSSPFEPVDTEGDDFGLIHNFQVVIGIHTGMGLLGR